VKSAAAAQVLDSPHLTRLWAAARAARERRGADGDARLLVESLSEAEALAADGLLACLPGRARTVGAGGDLRLSLSRLAAAVADAGDDLEAVLTRHGGPLADRPAEARRRRERAERFWSDLRKHPAFGRHTRLLEWLEHARSSGRLGNPVHDHTARTRLDTALRVVSRLPVREAERSALAAELAAGDPHALDTNKPLERLVRGMLAWLEGIDEGHLQAPAARELWGRYGVECDPTACAVLTLGLRPAGTAPLATALRAMSGRHFVLTLAQLESEPLSLEGPIWFTCENRSLIRLAERDLGERCPPLVCVGGWPNSAAHALLGSASAAGAELHYHGDFDWDGLAIADQVIGRYGARPWRFDPGSYAEAAERFAGRLQTLAPERRRDVDGPLAAALDAAGVAVPEELLTDRLLADLAVAARD
jgi:uncharacterized protein (TIGR02679 family)